MNQPDLNKLTNEDFDDLEEAIDFRLNHIEDLIDEYRSREFNKSNSNRVKRLYANHERFYQLYKKIKRMYVVAQANKITFKG